MFFPHILARDGRLGLGENASPEKCGLLEKVTCVDVQHGGLANIHYSASMTLE